jgi:hypothetical protein
MKPEFRSGSKKAIEEIAKELDLPKGSYLEDWSYISGEPEDIEKYITHYKVTEDEDKRFVLMEVIVQAMDDQCEKDQYIKHWTAIKPILKRDFKIHEYTIYYWACFDAKNLYEEFTVTPDMRQLWNEMTDQ